MYDHVSEFGVCEREKGRDLVGKTMYGFRVKLMEEKEREYNIYIFVAEEYICSLYIQSPQ